MKPSILTTCLVAVLAVAGSVAANAQTVADQAAVDASAPEAQHDPSAQSQANADRQPERLSDTRCLRETGSLIKQRDKDGKRACIQQAPGRAYTGEDIRRTGQNNLADALRTLDSAVY